jgi:hypothetical protein
MLLWNPHYLGLDSKEIIMPTTPSAIGFKPIPGHETNLRTQYVQPKLEQHQWNAVTGYSMPIGLSVDPVNLDWLNDALNDGES